MPAIGRNLDQIDPCLAHELDQRRPPLVGRRAKGVTHRRAVGVQQQPLARLGVLQFEQPDGRQLLLARIADANGDQVVPPSGAFEGRFKAAIEKIAQEKDDGAAVQDTVEEVEILRAGRCRDAPADRTARRG